MSVIVVAEKSIAGKRIAEILGEGKVKTRMEDGAQLFEFEKSKKKYTVIPLRGHIVEVDFPKKYSYWIGTDLKELTKAPIEYNSSQKQISSLLKKKAKEAERVIVATDADREGESIGVEALKYIQEGNPNVGIERAYFSAITKKDLEEAFSKLKKVDHDLADSADSRREIDLIWGAVLTRFLSLMAKRMGKSFLSVGRVQTPVLALIVDREKERNAFKTKNYWELEALLEKEGKKFLAMHKKGKFWKKEEAISAFKKKPDFGVVEKFSSFRKKLAKPVPFNTTEFLRAAAAIGFKAGEAMNIAESLYMHGYTSYPRTDNSTYPASLDLKEALYELKKGELGKEAEKVLNLGKVEASRGKESKDHPPIYPVSNASKFKIGERQWKVYELIARRFLATLHEEAETLNQTVEIDLEGEKYIARGQTILKKGWKEVYPYSKLSEVILPILKEEEKVKVLDLKLLEKETLPPARYSQSALIKLMEELGLGTKSTRHEIIQKLYARGYIFGNKAIEASKISFAVIEVLQKHSEKVAKPEMTAELEKKMDLIAEGKKKKKEVVEESRKILLEVLKDLLEHKGEVAKMLAQGLYEDTLMMKCPKCGKALRILHGKTGKRFLGCTGYPDCRNSYPLPQKGKIIATEKLCIECNAPIVKVSGRRGFWEMCVNMDCKTKDEWKKKTAEKKKKSEAAKSFGKTKAEAKKAKKKEKKVLEKTKAKSQNKKAKK